MSTYQSLQPTTALLCAGVPSFVLFGMPAGAPGVVNDSHVVIRTRKAEGAVPLRDPLPAG